MTNFTLLGLSLLACVGISAPMRGDVVESKYPDGSLHERWSVDANGRKHGLHETFRPDGTLTRRSTYVGGQLNGRDEEFAEDGTTVTASGENRAGTRTGTWTFVDPARARLKKADYVSGQVDGNVVVSVKDAIVSRQQWKKGQIERLEDVLVFPVSSQDLEEKLAKIQAVPVPPPNTKKDPLARERSDALRRLRAYRALCGVPYEGLTLTPELNDACQAVAEVFARNGEAGTSPTQPPGFDDARFRLAQKAALQTLWIAKSTLPGSVDDYLDDSTGDNIDVLSCRRWCLNPGMGKTGFGFVDGFSVMWAQDQSGKGLKTLDSVLYPPAGWCPVDMFGSRHAFSIIRVKGAAVKDADLRATIRPLDDEWVPGAPLALDHLGIATGPYGNGVCLVFRPKELKVVSGKRYWVEVSTDGGKTAEYRYVVAFCDRVPLPTK